ncbi:MAG: hypothetical protein HPAVJP_4280 [Candidatus Hepatoplasma vulgare]|nr:MAG: hypothetical protein HPAVJP_4280 [Candidatus Hepatoplasma sp.]
MSILDNDAEKVWKHYFGHKETGIDDYKNIIKKDDYKNKKSKYGWEIDYIKPKSKGGRDSLSNLRPLSIEEKNKRTNI